MAAFPTLWLLPRAGSFFLSFESDVGEVAETAPLSASSNGSKYGSSSSSSSSVVAIRGAGKIQTAFIIFTSVYVDDYVDEVTPTHDTIISGSSGALYVKAVINDGQKLSYWSKTQET
jgi:hypothetical protein